MFERLSGLAGELSSKLTSELGRRIHAFTAGTTLALGVVLVGQLGQSCALSGQ